MNIVVVGVLWLKIYFKCSFECPPHLLWHVVQYLFILMYNKIFSSIWIKRLLNKLPYVSYIECLCKIIWIMHICNPPWLIIYSLSCYDGQFGYSDKVILSWNSYSYVTHTTYSFLLDCPKITLVIGFKMYRKEIR